MLWTTGLLSLIVILGSKETPGVNGLLSDEACKAKSEAPETIPARVDIQVILKDIKLLRTSGGDFVMTDIHEDFQRQIKLLFDIDPPKISKLEQFYGLLYFLAKYKTLKANEIVFDAGDVYRLLISSRVFSSPTIPKQVKAVRLKWDRRIEQAYYEVDFNSSEVRLPLNGGKGFSSYREGMCQTAQELIFYGGFSFYLDQNQKDHIFASQFKNVDLFGRFGARGIVDVDIQYISLKSVEFLSGSPMGIVRAKVSRKEFEVNDHSVLLQLVTSMVTDKSTQPIDW